MRILFITSTRIGDAVLSTGILNHLIETHPQAQVTVACGPLPAPLFRDFPNVVRVIELEKKPLAGHWLYLWQRTFEAFWDIVVDLRGSGLSYLLLCKERFIKRGKSDDRHVVEEMASVIGLDPMQPPAPKVHLTEAHRTAARAMLNSSGEEDSTIISLGATANWRGKRWPTEHFITLARDLTAPDGLYPSARIALHGGPNERNQLIPLLEALPSEQIIDLLDCDLLTATACLEESALFIGNDSAVMHLAAAVGIPTVGLFGPTDEKRYGPWSTSSGPKTISVRTPQSRAALVNTPGFDHRSTDSLMKDLEPETVLNAIRGLTANTATAALGEEVNNLDESLQSSSAL